MSTKDTIKAAEALLKTFGPIVEAIPAVIAGLERQDQAEKLLAQLQKDYNALVDQYNKKLGEIEQAEVLLQKRFDARQEELNALETTAKDALADLAKKNREMGAKITARTKELDQAQAEATKRVAAIEAECKASEEAMRKASAARVAEIEVATAEAQKKHDDIVKKLEALKAKL